jgi:RNA recognition motif-containing protein
MQTEVKIVIVKQFEKEKTTREDLGDFFSECGAISSLTMYVPFYNILILNFNRVKDSTDASLGIGIITFQILSSATFAAQLSGSFINNRYCS